METATLKPAMVRHLVAIPFPGRGHVNSMMNLCKKFLSAILPLDFGHIMDGIQLLKLLFPAVLCLLCQYFDQHSNEKQIVKLVQEFMDQECIEMQNIRKRAKQLGEICHQAVEKGGSSETNMDVFINHISQDHSSQVV
ncbi:hypothetical protein Ddye_025015 [Dipteronia dyeriana]|uniref:Uncharacterized protein n=1 Tax=Dipteronia dyeriana TaxID=168575 RepID=A0AAD9TW37_9ROSI|nr:hypothetical protein Ddye_025015 [Dipteronia dyeriana]